MTVMAAPSAQDISIDLPLMISLATILVTIVIHALALIAVVHFIRREHRLGRTGVQFWRDLATVSTATLLTAAAHLVELIVWAVVFVLCGEFSQLAPAIYSSASLYTSLGYGDASHVVVMENVGAVRDSRWDANVRHIDCYRYFDNTVDASDEIPRSS